jgi:hypothetical protein
MKNNGLQRFVESYSVNGRSCKKIPVTQELQEKYHIQEAVNRLRESGRITEGADSPVTLYKFPISRFNHLNHNKRLYPRKLWERVIREQENEWRGRVGLADHPPEDSDGEFKNAAIIWHDMEVDDGDNLIWGTGSFVGPYGRLAQEIVDGGGRVGFSSSGFGELSLDGQTVNPDTYQLERVADVVLNPSQDVFGDSSNALNIEYSRGNIPESTTRKTESTNYSIQNEEGKDPTLAIKENRMDRNTEAQKPVSKLEEKKFRRDIQAFLEDASRMENPQARLQELEDIVTYFQEGVAPDLREQVESQILEEKKNLEKLLHEAQLTKQTFGVESSEQLKIGVALLAEEIKVAEAEAKDWESIAMVLKENNGKLRKALTEAHAKMNTLPTPSHVAELMERVKNLETQRKRNLYAYVEETKEKGAALQKADTLIESQQGIITKLKSQVVQLSEKSQKLEKQLSEVRVSQSKDSTIVKQLKETVAELEDAAKVQDETIKVLEAREERLKARLSEAIEANKQLNEGFETYKKELQEANTPRFIPSATERIGSHLNFREGGGAAVEAYWTDLVGRHGEAIKPFERQIRGAKTYREASAAYIRILPTIDEDNASAISARLPESTAISQKERQTMLEKAGMQFGGQRDITERMPKGWN